MSDKNKFTHNDYEIIDREVLYQGIFRLARYTLRTKLFAGGWSEPFRREVFERLNAAAVLPYDPQLDRVILIEQFRPGSLADPKSPWQIEIPAGVITDQRPPEEVACRESIEEANCPILELHPVCEYFVSPGGSNEYLYLYCGKVAAQNVNGIHGLKHEHEDIRVINIPAEEAFTKIYDGEIKNPPALITLLWLQLHRRQLQEVWKES